jgi:hypothetical protein
MNRTSTRVIDYQRLLDGGRAATIVVKLMMACNDMQLANEALSSWTQEQPRSRQYRQVGARMYFVRLQMAHLHEALNIIGRSRWMLIYLHWSPHATTKPKRLSTN